MKEDLPGYEKDIQVKDASLIAENKKQNLKSVQKRVTPIPKKNCKRKCTVPQPFSLSTEKRISKMISSLQRSTPSLSRSLSFKSNSTAASWTVHTSLRLERIEEPRQGTTKSGTINQKASSQKKGNGQVKQIDSKKSQPVSNPKGMDIGNPEKSLPFKATPLPSFYHKRLVTPKLDSIERVEQDMEITKTRKDSSFKAAPLPGFYHKTSRSLKANSLEKIEEKQANIAQTSSTFKATPLPRFYHKTSSPQKHELKKISLSRSKSPSDGFTSKPVESANNAASSQVNDSVKETIKSSLKGQWKAPDQKSKISKNIRPSCIDEIEKNVVSSIEKRSR
ncbi:uncharacterized protein A4U43_C04F14400 [Asparagus officinalis]|uniref:TPX2 C-terminal domain-containing protein n=1 Tax=Asparagus officinalis TaxID=4686 RepID=A0A5P1F5H6_ASPOF|nr:uncharacterized protein A4U43_C04F14400 [Asparagus officinalis]